MSKGEVVTRIMNKSGSKDNVSGLIKENVMGEKIDFLIYRDLNRVHYSLLSSHFSSSVP
jgi:hypothetical protein